MAAGVAPAQWAGLPAQWTLRVVSGRVGGKGFRVRHVTVVTTLLDPAPYPAEAILRACLQRWRLESCPDDLKTTLHLDTLRGRTPAAVRQEASARLIAHNLVRWPMAQAARTHAVPLTRISFKGTLDALQPFGAAMSGARTLATDLVPARPARAAGGETPEKQTPRAERPAPPVPRSPPNATAAAPVPAAARSALCKDHSPVEGPGIDGDSLEPAATDLMRWRPGENREGSTFGFRASGWRRG
jgi:hypothetical protein